MRRDDAGNNNHKGPGRPADLGLRTSQQRDQKSGHDRTVDSRLRRQSRRNRERHGQRKSYQPHRDPGNQVSSKFVQVVVAKTEDRLRKPTFFQESTRHLTIMTTIGANTTRTLVHVVSSTPVSGPAASLDFSSSARRTATIRGHL